MNHRALIVIVSLVILNHFHEYKFRNQSKTLKMKQTTQLKLVSYDGCWMTCKSGTVTWRVESLPEIIISDDQLKSQENIPEYPAINEESNLFMLVLVTLFLSGLDHFITIFHFCSSTWLASIKTKIVKRPTILNSEKLGFQIYVSKKNVLFIH